MNLIDTHLHLIYRDWAPYGWTAGAPALATGDFTLEDAQALYGGAVAGSIFMEVGVEDDAYQNEARQVGAMVHDGRLLGQIASCRPEVEAGFADWLEECEGLGVVGYRRILHVVPDELSLSETFTANLRRIGAKGRVFDMCFLARQLPLALMLARACPDTQFVLDHCGVPDVAGGAIDPWRADMTALAGLPNVAVKMSGVTAYAGDRGAAAVAPYLDHILATFGPDRVVWGSDWPVVNLGVGMGDWIAMTRAVLGRLTDSEQAAIAHGNAERIYKVQLA